MVWDKEIEHKQQLNSSRSALPDNILSLNPFKRKLISIFLTAIAMNNIRRRLFVAFCELGALYNCLLDLLTYLLKESVTVAYNIA